MDKKATTRDSYDTNAHSIADKFDRQGARISDIDEVFALIGKQNPKVVEIGCGNGRDAKEILKHTNDYLGFDISGNLIELAREKVPEGKFEVADVEGYLFPKGIDAVIAFASLLHVDRESLAKIFNEAYEALNPGGIFRISLKYSEEYCELEKKDEFGTRTFYLYSDKDIKDLARDFKILKMERIEKHGQVWLEVTLQK